MDGDGEPGQRRPGAAGLRKKPSESRNVQRAQDPAPCPTPLPPGKQDYFKMVQAFSEGKAGGS